MTEQFDHIKCWYPVAFLRDISPDSMTPFSVYDEDFVLLRSADNNLTCLQDKCPHRAAKLSAGKMAGDIIECQYHGWRFDLHGKCVKIPQLDPNIDIPARACVKTFQVVAIQGLVWFWFGDSTEANTELIPTIPELDNEDNFNVDYCVDLPYDQSYLIENVIDVAHIHIAHHGIRGGGHRELALPLDFKIEENSASGIKAQYKSIGLPEGANSPLKAAHIHFVAPNLIHYVSEYKNTSLNSGLALYSLPLGQQRCRLLYRKYGNFYSWKERITPRWLEHHTQNVILQQDMAIITGQYKTVEESDQELHKLWLPIKTSDQLVLAYRKWLDTHGTNLPFYRGYQTSHMPVKPATHTGPDDFKLIHTRHCSDCSKMHRVSTSLQKWLRVSAVLLALLAIWANSMPLKSSALLLATVSLGALFGVKRLKTIFKY